MMHVEDKFPPKKCGIFCFSSYLCLPIKRYCIMKKVFLLILAVVSLGLAVYAKGDGGEEPSKAPEGVEAVDLGLSVKWANMNVGAKRSTGYGTYFAWGETQPKSYYSWNTYTWSKGDGQLPSKYSNNDRMFQLTPSDDAARANWGGKWRMPTKEEYEELINPDNCSWEWTTKDGVNGYKVTGKRTGKSIFLPITGFRFYENVQFRGIYGIYWTSSLYTTSPSKAWCLEFDFSDISVHYGNLSGNRFSGRCIRAVQ